jgi:feruloyl-CoA synthase
VQDAVITGLNQDEVGALVLARLDELRVLVGAAAPADATLAQLLATAPARAFFQGLVDRLAREATGSASRVTRLHVLVEPPSIDHGEVTDKGSINQRAVLARRAALVEALHTGADPSAFVANPG